MPGYSELDFQAQPARSPASGGFSEADFAAPPVAPKGSAGFSESDFNQPSPVSGSGMSIPQIAQDQPTDVSASEAYSAAIKGLHLTLKGIEPLSIPIAYLAEAAKRMQGQSPSQMKQTWIGIPKPDATFTDVASYAGQSLWGPDQAAMAEFIKNGGSAADAAKQTGWKAAAIYGLGGLADIFLDPMMHIGVGGNTQAEQKALQSGENAGRNGSLISLRNPVTGNNYAEITKAQVEPLGRIVGKGFDTVTPTLARNTVTDAVEFAKSFVPETGDIKIDAMKRATLNTNDMVPKLAAKEYLDTRFKAGILSGSPEDKISTIVAEKTPNLMPELIIPEGTQFPKLTPQQAAKESAVLGLHQNELEPQIRKQVQKVAADLGHELPPQRLDAVVNDVMQIKKMNAIAVQAQQAAGKLSLEQPLSEQLIENYVAHVMDIRVAKAKSKMENISVDEAMNWTEKEAVKAIEGAKLTTSKHVFGQQREATRGMTIAESNAAMSDKYADLLKKAGTNSFFVDSAYEAAFMNMNQKIKAANSKHFIDYLETRGFKWVPADSKVIIKDGEVVKYSSGPGRFLPDDAHYPKSGSGDAYRLRAWAENSAAKLTYAVARTEGNFTKMANIYNRVFRSSALFKPAYYLQNWADALYKNMTQYVLPTDYTDAVKAFSNKGQILLDGRLQPAKALMNEIETLGVVKFSHSAEAYFNSVAMGKRLTAEGAPAEIGKAKRLVNWIEQFGASGENISRAALYINRRKQGYNPTQALYDVENIHFNFGETTKNLDRVRTFFPFFQFPVKSLRIAGELTVRRPGLSSQFVTFQDKLDKALNDPMESALISRISPGYKQIQNGIPAKDMTKAFEQYNNFIDDILGANSWVAKNLLTARYSEEAYSALSKYGLSVKFPVGPDALTPWMVWEKAVRDSGGPMSGPLADAMMVLLTGVDPFTKESYDIGPDGGGKNVLGASMYQLASGALIFPQAAKVLKQAFNPPDDRFFTPPAQLWIKGMFGGQMGFIDIDNLDRMYLFKKSRLMAEYKDLTAKFNMLNKREVINGNANTSWLSQVPGTTAKEVYNEILAIRRDVMAINLNEENIKPKRDRGYPVPDLAKVVADMKGILKENKEMDDNYVMMKNGLVKSNAKARKALSESQTINDQPDPDPTPEPSVDVEGNNEQNDQGEETD